MTKALEPTNAMRKLLRERDVFDYPPHPCCVICHKGESEYNRLEVAHYRSRGRGGLANEYNLVLLCRKCHEKTDQSGHRKDMLRQIREYLMNIYPDWNEEDIVYRKGL